MRWLFAPLLAGFLLLGISPSWAGECVTPDQVTTKMMGHFKGLRAVNLQEKEAQTFLSAFNALPPPSTLKADQVLIFILQGNPAAELVLFVKGCMTKHGAVPVEMIQPLVGDGA